MLLNPGPKEPTEFLWISSVTFPSEPYQLFICGALELRNFYYRKICGSLHP